MCARARVRALAVELCVGAARTPVVAPAVCGQHWRVAAPRGLTHHGGDLVAGGEAALRTVARSALRPYDSYAPFSYLRCARPLWLTSAPARTQRYSIIMTAHASCISSCALTCTCLERYLQVSLEFGCTETACCSQSGTSHYGTCLPYCTAPHTQQHMLPTSQILATSVPPTLLS